MKTSFKSFLILYVSLIAIVMLLIFLYTNGILFQAMIYLLYIALLVAIGTPLFILQIRAENLTVRIKAAKSDELQREDDVLLQAVAFSQTILFFFVNLTLTNGNIKVILSLMIAIFAIAFYVTRALAKIKDNNKYRYRSMILLAVIIGNNVTGFLGAITYSVMPNLSAFLPFAPGLFSLVIVLTFYSGVTEILVTLFKIVFKKRYDI